MMLFSKKAPVTGGLIRKGASKNEIIQKNAWHDEQENPDLDPTPVTITDIRGREEDFTLEKQGFKVIRLEHENE